MLLAMVFLVSIGQAATTPMNLVILALALIVAYGRRADLGRTFGAARPAA